MRRLFILLLLPLIVGAQLLEKETYSVGEPVLINTTNTTSKIIVQSPEGQYRLLDIPGATVPFIPSVPGEHHVALVSDIGEVLERSSFNVTEDEPARLTRTITVTPAPGYVNEDVLISIRPAPETSVRVIINGPGGTFRYFGPWTDSPFQPREAGPHEIIVTESEEVTARQSFDVLQRREDPPPPAAPEITEPTREDTAPVATLRIVDHAGKSVQTPTTIRKKAGGRFDLEIQPQFGTLTIRDIREGDDINIGVSTLDSRNITLNGTVLDAFAINIETNFSSGSLDRVAKGGTLWKCAGWNFSAQRCDGTWEQHMRITPGRPYSIPLFPGDPGYAETGVATVNTKKPIYRPGETAEMVMVVLDTGGRLVQGAAITLTVTDPNNSSTAVSGITETSRGIYEAAYTTAVEGTHLLDISAIATNVNSSMASSFLVQSSYAFDIVRDVPATTDPFSGPFNSTITITSYVDASTFSCTEIVPASFVITNAGGATVTANGNETRLTWDNLTNSSTVSYEAQPPKVTPDLHTLGQIEIAYDGQTFTEARPWYLAIDPVDGFNGSFYMLWENTTFIPVNWTCVSCQSGDDFYQRLVRGNDTFGNTGGASWHNHTPTLESHTAGDGVPAKTQGNPMVTQAHTHPASAYSVENVSNLPAYKELLVIRHQGVPDIIPEGAIGFFDTHALPSGWTRYDDADDRFIRGVNGTATGGSDAHDHDASFTLAASSDTLAGESASTDAPAATHTHTVSGTTGSADHKPPYIGLVLAQADSDTAIPNAQGFIAMFNATPNTTQWNVVSNSSGALYGRFVRGSPTYGGTGGSTNHTHSNLIATSSSPTGTLEDYQPVGPDTNIATTSHTHETNTSFSTDSHLPPYIDVIFAEAVNIPQAASINDVQCMENDAWGSCSGVLYSDTLQAVRANCTSTNPIENVTFQFDNVADGTTYFTANSTYNVSDYWVYNNTDITMNHSGLHRLAVTCYADGSTQSSTLWTIPWGSLTVVWLDPTTSDNVTRNRFRTFSVNVTCTGGECGDINATLDPITVGNPSNATAETANIIDVAGDDEESGDVTGTRGNDGAYLSIGEVDNNQPANSLINLSYNISAIGVNPLKITEINFTITYCHSGDDAAPDCNGGTGAEKSFSGTQDIYAYNFTSGSYVDIGDLSTTNDENEETVTVQLATGLTDLVSGDDLLYFEVELVTSGGTGSQDAWLAVEQAVVWVTYSNDSLSKGIISTVVGSTPFYTTDENPVNGTSLSCLLSMRTGDWCEVSWDVNATGDTDIAWEFFAYANSTHPNNNVSPDETPHINITIVDNTAPIVSAITLAPALPSTAQNLTCTVTVSDPNSQDTLTANVTWYRNDVYYSSTIESLSNGASHEVILGSGNTTPGEGWICGATPTDQIATGSQVNSSEVTILTAQPPSLGTIQCYENNTIWTDCSNIIFGDTLAGVRAECTGPENAISNVSFNLTNDPDGNFFFNVSTNNLSDNWYYYENITIDDSGTFNLNVTCVDNTSFAVSSNVTWFLPWGVLSSDLIDPFDDVTVEQNVFFTFTAQVECSVGECGDVNATLDPITAGNPANATSEAGAIVDTDGNDEEGGVHTATHGNDGSYYAMGETDSGTQPTNSLMNLTYDISLLSITPSDITEINWTIIYCHSGEDSFAAVDCNGDDAIEKAFSGTQDVYVYNFTSGSWVDIGDLDTTNAESEVTSTYQLTTGFADLINNDIIYFRTEIVTDGANGDAWFAMEHAVAWITYSAGGGAKSGAVSTIVGDTPFYTTDSNPQNASDQACLGSMIAGDTCLVSWDVNATGQVGSTHEFFVDFNLTTNRATVGDNATDIINITIQNSNLVPPVVIHVSPSNGTYSNTSSNVFVCNATDNNGLANMSLYADFTGTWQFNQTNTVTGTGNSTNFTKSISDGSYLWACRAEDINSNVDWFTTNWTLIVDTVRPTINLTGPQNGTNFTTGAIAFNFTVTESWDSSLLCNLTLNGDVEDSNFAASNSSLTLRNITGLAQGTYLWNVTCVDNAGNYNTSVTWEFSIIDLPPNATLLSPANNTLHQSSSISLRFNATDNNNATLSKLILNGVNVQNITDALDNQVNEFNVSGLAEGLHNWTVNVSDVSGLSDTPDVWWFTIDFTAPNITLNAPEQGYNTTNSTITFNWTAVDNLAQEMGCNITIDSAVVANNVSTTNNTPTTQAIANITDGLHSWNVTCIDGIGNSNTSATRQFNVSAPPTVTLNAPSVNASLSQVNVVFNYTPSDNTNLSSCTLYINDLLNATNQTPVVNNAINNFSVNDFGEGRFNWTVECSDTIGLRQNSTTRDFTIDRTPPNISLNLPAGGVQVTGPTVNFSYTATDNLATTINCNITVNGTVNDTYAAQNGTLAARLVNITSEGLHIWNVTCVDLAGNTNTSEVRNFTLVQPPTVQLNTPPDGTLLTDNDVALVYYTEDNTGLANSSLYLNGVFNQTNQSPVANFDINNFTLNDVPDGVYNWTVFVTDLDGLTSESETWEFSVDTVAPTVTIIYPDESDVVATNNVTFNFTVTDLTDTTLICNITRNQSVTFSNISVTNGTYHIETELLADGSYNWTVMCIDDASRVGAHGPVNFTVEAPPNVTLGTPPIGYRTTNTTVFFNYTPVDPIGFANCSLTINGTINTTNTSIIENIPNNFTVSGFADGAYNWTVLCLDDDLNPFAPANRTFAIDLSGPAINLTYPEEGVALNVNNVTFNWTATDFNSSILVICNVTLDDVVNQTNISGVSGQNMNATIPDLEDGPHNWSVTCTDDLGNVGTSVTGNFSINQPDLYLDDSRISFNSTNPDIGDTLNITANVSNIGGSSASNVNVSFWDGDPENGGTFIGHQIGSLPFNSSVIFSVAWVITEGYHTIYVSADPLGTIGELNETNNNATRNISALKVNITALANNTYTADNTPRLDFNATDYTSNNITYWVFVDGARNGQNGSVVAGTNASLNLSALSDGIRQVIVMANDTLGRAKNSTTWYYRIDTTAPTTNFTTPNASWYSANQVTVHFNITDLLSTNINYTVFLDGILNHSNTTTNNSARNATFSGLSEGVHTVIVQATDEVQNTGNSTPLILYVDLTAPVPNITTANNSWQNTSAPNLTFTITDNLDSVLNWSFFVDGSINVNGSSANATNASALLSGLSEGAHTIVLQAYDEAGNYQNSTPMTLNVDFTAPNVTLNAPQNDSNLTSTSTILNFSVTDNLDTVLVCNVTLDGTVVNASMSIANGSNGLTAVSNLAGGYHYWNVTCVDEAANYGTSDTWRFFVALPDFVITSANITFSNSTPAENQTISLYANVYNEGSINYTGNITVQFWRGDPDNGGVQVNGNLTITNLTIGENKTVNLSYNPIIGLNQIYVVVDPPTATNGTVPEENETNNVANRSLWVGLFEVFAGGSGNLLHIADASIIAAFTWNQTDVTGSNVFVADSDSSISFTSLYALGRNTTNGTTVGTSDFEEVDTAISTSSLNDSVNLTFTVNGAALALRNISSFKRQILDVPIVNSTNTSSFQTGILWDSSDSNQGFYNGSQDAVFVTIMNQSQQGQYGVYDYEIRVPARLRDYIAGGGTVTFYTELR